MGENTLFDDSPSLANTERAAGRREALGGGVRASVNDKRALLLCAAREGKWNGEV
jgi:hypothetical protein